MAAPVVNINTSGAKGLTNVSNAESTTNFSGFRHSGGGTPSPTNEVNVFVQGTQAVSIKVSGSSRDEGVWYTNVGSVDLTTNATKHVFIWAAMTDMAQLNTRANGGFYIIIGSSTSNWNKYYVNGSDTIDGRFVRYVLDVTKTPSATAGTPATLTAVTHIGIGVTASAITGKAENLVLDRIDYGTGLQIEDGDATTPATWLALFNADNNISNRYGIIDRRSGVFFLKGGVTIGDPVSSTTLWKDTSAATVVFENPQYYNGSTVVSAIDAPNLYQLEVLGNGTGTTDVTFGRVIGSGDDRQGISGGLIRSAGPKWSWDSETDIADLDTVSLYGLTLRGAGLVRLSGSAKTAVVGCTFDGCDEGQPNDAEFLNFTLIGPEPDRGLEMVASHNIKLGTFVSRFASGDFLRAQRAWQVDASPLGFVTQTEQFASPATADVTPFPATEAVGDYFAFGSTQKFAGATIDVATARSGGTLVWEYWSGSGWSALVISEDVTVTLSVTGPGTVRWTLPTDWAATSLTGERPLFYVRLRVTGTMTTNPILDEGQCDRLVERHLHIPAAGTYTGDGMKFFGDGDSIENSAAATARDSYAASNVDFNQAINNGFFGRGQSFTTPGGGPFTLTSATFYMDKEGSPTGDVVAKLYAHSGTYGTSSVPTGAALATSVIIDAADFPAFPAIGSIVSVPVTFEFEDQYAMASSTQYVIAVEYEDGTDTNFLRMGTDNSSPSHGGNQSSLNSSSVWSAQSGRDLGFSVNSGALVTYQAVGASAVGDAVQTGSPQGATVIVQSVTVTFDKMKDDTEVRVYATGTSTELAGIENATAGSADNRNFAASLQAGTAVDYWIFSLEENPITAVNFTWPSTAQTINVQQLLDRNYENP